MDGGRRDAILMTDMILREYHFLVEHGVKKPLV